VKSVTLRCRQNASSEEESNGREKITCPDTFSLSCSFKDITEQLGATCVPVAVKRWEIEDLKFGFVKVCTAAETNCRIQAAQSVSNKRRHLLRVGTGWAR